MMTANINRSDKTPPYEDVTIFLPYPDQWLKDNHSLAFKVSPSVAREFLKTYDSYDAEVELAFTSWMPTLRILAAE
jgi:hypothetical protein